jgi:hypothetical protein
LETRRHIACGPGRMEMEDWEIIVVLLEKKFSRSILFLLAHLQISMLFSSILVLTFEKCKLLKVRI